MLKYWKDILIIVLAIIVFILITSTLLAPIVTWSNISDKELVITFLGILATFIVVGNYAQVSDIRHRMEQELEKRETDINTLIFKTDQLRNDLSKLDRYATKHVDDLESTIAEQSDADRTYAKDEIIKESQKIRRSLLTTERLIFTSVLTIHNDYEVILKLLSRLSKSTISDIFNITVTNGQKEEILQVTALITEQSINFYHNKLRVDPQTVKSVEGTSIHFPILIALFQLYQDIFADKTKKDYSGTTFDTERIEGEDDSFNKNKSE